MFTPATEEELDCIQGAIATATEWHFGGLGSQEPLQIVKTPVGGKAEIFDGLGRSYVEIRAVKSRQVNLGHCLKTMQLIMLPEP